MKRVNETLGRLLRLSLTASALLATQQALAVGTPAGDTISNTATVQYSVGGIAQGDITSAPATFVVDRLVNFTLLAEDSSSTAVTPGGAAGIASYLLTNLGNADQDFQLAADNIVGGTINGIDDLFEMNTPIQVFADINDDGLLDAGDTPYVDALTADDSSGGNVVRILVVASAPVGPANGAGATVELTVTAAEGIDAGNPTGTVMTNDTGADDPGVEQVVLATGSLLVQDGFVVSTADIAVTKATAVISDPFNASNPKAIPGAVVEYAITATNTGAEDATGIGFRDPLDLGLVTVALSIGDFGGADAVIEQGGSSVFSCTLDEDDTDADGCGLFDVATTPEVRIVPPAGSAVTLDGTLTPGQATAIARFRVTVN